MRSTCSAKEIGSSGQIAIVSAAATRDEPERVDRVHEEGAEEVPAKMKLVKIVYGNDDPATATVLQGLLSAYPNLKGIISPTTVGISQRRSARHAKYCGKNHADRPRHADAMKKYVKDGTVQAFELWNPADLGYLAAYAAASLASKAITARRAARSRPASSASTRVGAGTGILSRPADVFNKANIAKFNF